MSCPIDKLLARLIRKRIYVKALGADKNYRSRAFVAHLREHHIWPHIVRAQGRVTGLDAPTTRRESSRISQRKSKRIVGIPAWLRTVSGMRKSRVISIARKQMRAYLAARAYSLPRRCSWSQWAHGQAMRATANMNIGSIQSASLKRYCCNTCASLDIRSSSSLSIALFG